MSYRLTIRLPQDLAKWLEDRSGKTGLSPSRIVTNVLEATKAESGKQPFLRLAGLIDGRPDLSTRNGYSRR